LLLQSGVKPVLVYDGDCRFCRRWVSRWQARTKDRVEFAPYQEPGVLSRLGIPLAAGRRSVQLAMPDGAVYEGAEAVFRMILLAPGRHVIARLGRLPALRWVAQRVYRFAASHRMLASRIDRALFSRPSEVALR
jgi:predicted DCC family thiol-disulfide oxidoreductase YuxK